MQQLESLLGPQGLKIAWWIFAFAAVLVMIVVALRVLRSLMGASLNIGDRSGRGRAPRLGVTEYFNLDRQGRRLVMVRRDNVEHLVLIGGPNDVLIESNIVRGAMPRIETREQAGASRGEMEDFSRIEPLPPVPARQPAIEPQTVPEPARQLAPFDSRQPVAGMAREDLANRLEEVLRKPLPPRTAPSGAEPPVPPPAQPVAAPPQPAPMRAEARPVSTGEFRVGSTAASLARPSGPIRTQPDSWPAAPLPADKPPAPEPKAPEIRAAEARPQDQGVVEAKAADIEIPNLKPQDARVPEVKVPGMLADALKPKPGASPSPAEAASAKRPEDAPKPEPSKNPFDSLEEEMARLLGRGLGDKP